MSSSRLGVVVAGGLVAFALVRVVQAVPGGPALTLAQQEESLRAEHVARRDLAMDRLADGVVLLHARSAPKDEEAPSFRQDASFFYFTGLARAPGAILALDGPRRESILFVAPAPSSFGQAVGGLSPAPDGRAADRLGVTRVVPWAQFVDWVSSRLAAGVTLYVDSPRRPEMDGAPPGMPSVSGPFGLWRQALEQTFPGATIESALEQIRELRWTKSEQEVGRLRRNAAVTVAALRAAASRIGPGATQRQVEAAVISACLEGGAQGPSFWPWTMSGPNAQIDGLVGAFYSYEHLNREMGAGELVRVDIGCHGEGYGADVGRTLPVNGRFSQVQSELWDLLIDGYLAGLAAMADGVAVAEVRAASRMRVRAEGAHAGSAAMRAAVAQLDSDSAWHLHGVGIESGEEALPILRSGAVIAYEPMLSVGADVFYLEDMILITETGHEVLSAGLPYRATDLADLMESERTGRADDQR